MLASLHIYRVPCIRATVSLSPWMAQLAEVAGYMSRAEQNDRKLLQESKGIQIAKVHQKPDGTKSVYHGTNLSSVISFCFVAMF